MEKYTFGFFLKAYRQNKKINQKELAIMLDMTQASVSNYELGKRHPDKKTKEKILKILKVNDKKNNQTLDKKKLLYKIKKIDDFNILADIQKYIDFFD